jgi:hypothetical protein
MFAFAVGVYFCVSLEDLLATDVNAWNLLQERREFISLVLSPAELDRQRIQFARGHNRNETNIWGCERRISLLDIIGVTSASKIAN